MHAHTYTCAKIYTYIYVDTRNALLLNSPEPRSNLPYEALIEFKRLMILYMPPAFEFQTVQQHLTEYTGMHTHTCARAHERYGIFKEIISVQRSHTQRQTFAKFPLINRPNFTDRATTRASMRYLWRYTTNIERAVKTHHRFPRDREKREEKLAALDIPAA